MTLQELYEIIEDRKRNLPGNSYTTTLFKEGLDKIVQKVGEESIEVLVAAKNKSKQRLIEEISDLLYHLLVLLGKKDISLEEIEIELEKRVKYIHG